MPNEGGAIGIGKKAEPCQTMEGGGCGTV